MNNAIFYFFKQSWFPPAIAGLNNAAVPLFNPFQIRNYTQLINFIINRTLISYQFSIMHQVYWSVPVMNAHIHLGEANKVEFMQQINE